eukprot:1763967-Rhodomonas_salina.1
MAAEPSAQHMGDLEAEEAEDAGAESENRAGQVLQLMEQIKSPTQESTSSDARYAVVSSQQVGVEDAGREDSAGVQPIEAKDTKGDAEDEKIEGKEKEVGQDLEERIEDASTATGDSNGNDEEEREGGLAETALANAGENEAEEEMVEEEEEDDHNYEITDFSMVTPWERLIQDIENILLTWGLDLGKTGAGWDGKYGPTREHTVLNSSQTKGVRHRCERLDYGGRKFVLRHVEWLPEGQIAGAAGVCGVEQIWRKRSSAATSSDFVLELGCGLGLANYIVLAPDKEEGVGFLGGGHTHITLQDCTLLRSALAIAQVCSSSSLDRFRARSCFFCVGFTCETDASFLTQYLHPSRSASPSHLSSQPAFFCQLSTLNLSSPQTRSTSSDLRSSD